MAKSSKFFVLCISKFRKKVTVKVLSADAIPPKGEELVLLGAFSSRRAATRVRKKFGDKNIIRNWRIEYVIDYSKMYPYRRRWTSYEI